MLQYADVPLFCTATASVSTDQTDKHSFPPHLLIYALSVSPPTRSGAIPPEIGGLTALQKLYLNNNSLTGEQLRWHLTTWNGKIEGVYA